MKIDADEKELLESVERGEWKPAGGGERDRTRYSRYAKATFRQSGAGEAQNFMQPARSSRCRKFGSSTTSYP
jgi:hypothetical protein